MCRKLKIPNVRVREVFECNRRRLADVPHFRQSTKLRKGHVLLVPDENAVLKTTVTAWDGWSKDGENWIETWTGRDQDGQQHDLEAEDIYTGTGFDVRGDTPGHQVIGQRVHGDSPLLVVAYMPAMDEGPMSGPALWKVSAPLYYSLDRWSFLYWMVKVRFLLGRSRFTTKTKMDPLESAQTWINLSSKKRLEQVASV